MLTKVISHKLATLSWVFSRLIGFFKKNYVENFFQKTSCITILCETGITQKAKQDKKIQIKKITKRKET